MTGNPAVLPSCFQPSLPKPQREGGIFLTQIPAFDPHRYRVGPVGSPHLTDISSPWHRASPRITDSETEAQGRTKIPSKARRSRSGKHCGCSVRGLRALNLPRTRAWGTGFEQTFPGSIEPAHFVGFPLGGPQIIIDIIC